MFPSRTAVGRSIKSAPGPAVVQAPRSPPCLPQRRKNDIRIVRIKRDVDPTRVFVLIKNLLPSLAAIGRAENSALRIRPIRMPQRRDKHDVWIRRMDNDLPDRPRIMEPDVLPGLPAVERFVNPITVRDVPSNASFPRTH